MADFEPLPADRQRSLEVGNGDVRLILESPRPSTDAATRVVVTLIAPGLDATRLVDVAGELPDFFADLAHDWRGWDGPRGWLSRDGELKLACYHDRIGHVSIEVSLGNLPPARWHTPGWMAQGMLVVDPGALLVLSTSVGHLLADDE